MQADRLQLRLVIDADLNAWLGQQAQRNFPRTTKNMLIESILLAYRAQEEERQKQK